MQNALKTIQLLLQGLDPVSLKPLPPDCVCRNKHTQLAFKTIIEHLQNKPPNHAKPWTTSEDTRLLNALQNQIPLANIAQSHLRSLNAIRKRIKHLLSTL